MDSDRLRRFTLEEHGIRGSLIRLHETWHSIRETDTYTPAVGRILGQAAAAAALIGRNLKFDGRLTLQLQGSGPLHLLVVQCTHELRLRGLAKCRATLDADFPSLVQPARMTVTVETGAEQERYQSIIPVEERSLAECLGTYYQHSVQVPTAFWLNVDDSESSGMMLQRMPGASIVDDGGWHDLVRRVTESIGTALGHASDEDVLTRVFEDRIVRVFKPDQVEFRCGCSDGAMRRMLRMLGEAELHDIVAEQGHIEVRCEFCNRQYTVTEPEIPGLLREVPDTGAQTLH